MKDVVTFHLGRMFEMQPATSVGHLHVHMMHVKWHLMLRLLQGMSYLLMLVTRCGFILCLEISHNSTHSLFPYV